MAEEHRGPEVLPPCEIHIDKEGRWYHKGVEMVHRDFIRLFYQSMEWNEHHGYVIHLNGQRCYVDVADTAFVVRRIVYEGSSGEGDERFMLFLSDDSREALSPDTLFIGKDNVPYCEVKRGAFPARFLRAAYYQLADYLKEEGGAYYLPLRGKKYFVQAKDG